MPGTHAAEPNKKNRQPGGTGCLKEGFEKGFVTLAKILIVNIEEIMKGYYPG